MIKSFFNTAFRNIWRQKVSSLINITGLSIGLASFILILLWVSHELNYDKHYEDSEHIYLIYKKIPAGNSFLVNSQVPYPYADAIREGIPEAEAVTRVSSYPSLVKYKNLSFNEQYIVAVDSPYFDIFKYNFIIGNKETALPIRP